MLYCVALDIRRVVFTCYISSMTNPKNAIVVVAKMLVHLRGSNDMDMRKDLVAKIVSLADRFSPSPMW